MKAKLKLLFQIVVIVQAICSIIFSIYLNNSKLVPGKYQVLVIVGEIILLVVAECIIFFNKKRWLHGIGIIISCAISALCIIACMYITKTKSAIENITDVSEEKAQVSVYVFDSDQAQSITDAKAYKFGILTKLDRENTDSTIKNIETNVGNTIQIVEYAGLSELADGMMDNGVQAIILNEGYLDLIGDLSQPESTEEFEASATYPDALRDYAGFVESLRKLETFSVKNQIEDNQSSNANGTFVMYISGIDTFGGISTKSRSDVNILAVVNTNTKKILLVSTPRDYYVPLSISNGVKDKLTHAGIYGIQCSSDTLEMLYGVDIDYYFRVNFSGFENIIDALGGITVWSDYDFTVEPVYHYVKGDNYLNGIQALAFARERHAFASGDNQRGSNQMNVIISVFNKATSSAVLSNYTELLSSLDGSFETNMSYDEIAALVRKQLTEGTGWDISTYSVVGTGKDDYTYSMSDRTVYVMEPDMNSVEEAKNKISEILGEK